MKRIFILVSAISVVSSSYAYYGRSSSFELPGWLTFMGLVMIIWGILEIILFFKIWGMTNDIKEMKKDHFNEIFFESKGEMANYLRKNLVIGNMEKVKRVLLKNFMDNVERGYRELPAYVSVKDDNGKEKYINIEERNLNESITPYVDNLILQYGKIGEEVPVYIKRMKTFRDYYKLFVKEELTVKLKKQK